MTDYWVLDEDHNAVPAKDVLEWGRFFERPDRRVGTDQIGDVRISTVFLGINHRFGPGEPLLFETMIFGGEHDQYQARCSTWAQAEAQHAEAVALVKQTMH